MLLPSVLLVLLNFPTRSCAIPDSASTLHLWYENIPHIKRRPLTPFHSTLQKPHRRASHCYLPLPSVALQQQAKSSQWLRKCLFQDLAVLRNRQWRLTGKEVVMHRDHSSSHLPLCQLHCSLQLQLR